MVHIPVLLNEVLSYTNAAQAEKVIDGTVGGGGYLKAILETNQRAKILGIDLDQGSLDEFQKELAQRGLDRRCILVQGNYRNIDKFAGENDFTECDLIILDLGFSSAQLADPGRGLSFAKPGPLDMRYDKRQELTAYIVVNRYHENQISKIIKDYGEEKFHKKIARAIVAGRKISPIDSTGTLYNLIRHVLPPYLKHKTDDHARRVFQAIRIEVNSELENLTIALPKALELLKPNGRMGIISFHSLEDRIVKQFFVEQNRGCTCPVEFPECICGKKSKLKILTKKPVTAQAGELAANPRSKPAKLRVGEKL